MLKKYVDGIMALLLSLGCLALFAMVLVTALDVGLRYFFNSPITSGYELSEVLMGVMSPLAILYCAYRNGHVCVDLFFERLPPMARRGAWLLAQFVVLAAASVLAWQSWHLALELKSFGLVSPVLGIPMWPVGGVFVLAFALYVPVVLYRMLQGGKA